MAVVETSLAEDADAVRRRARLLAGCAVDGPDAAGLAWAPDGASLALAGRDGLWVVGRDGRGLRQIVAGPARAPSWSPGGLAFVLGGRVHLVSAAGSGLRPVVEPSSEQPRWSPDGSSLAYLADGAIHVLADGAARRVPGPSSVVAFAWSPDGARFACLARPSFDEPPSLFVLADGTARELTGDPDLALGLAVRGDDPRGTEERALLWSQASGRIYVESSRHGCGPLAWFDPSLGSSGVLLDGSHACLEPTVSDTGRIAVVVCGPDSPGDVWVLDEDGTHSERITSVPAAAASPTEHVVIGGSVDAWLTGPLGGPPAPLVVNVHGGPYYAIGWRFTFEVQRIAAQGGPVLTLNPRGSSGRGPAFARANRGDWGGIDAQDVLAATAWASSRPDVDASRVAIWGVSYGGFLAQWLLATSDVFELGISENGISDFAAIRDERPDARAFWDFAHGSPANRTARSPVHLVDRISAPLLLVHADDDESVPLAQSVRMHEALVAHGVASELLRLPGEGHLVNLAGRPSSRLRRAAAVDAWLARIR